MNLILPGQTVRRGPSPTADPTLFRSIPRFLLVLALLLFAGCPAAKPPAPPTRFAFAVAADPRNYADNWFRVLQEVRDMRTQRPPALPPAELLLVVGDLDPVADRYQDYESVFQGSQHMKAFLPVMGNHDQGENDRAFMLRLIANDPRFHPRDADSASYFFDWQNVRFIAVDAYRSLGKDGIINDAGSAWVEETIVAAPGAIEHIFICFHQPAFPRRRHVGESFDEDPSLRDSFWNMLLRHRERVRAVFVAHTHSYSRLRVLDPAGKAANDPELFPDEPGGILQVDVGAAGKGERNSVVFVGIDGLSVRFRAVDTKAGQGAAFGVIDEWTVPATGTLPGP